MNYSNEPKPAKILNLQSLDDISDTIFLRKELDVHHFSAKKPENNVDRLVFHIETANINITPNVRLVKYKRKGIEVGDYHSFVIEPKEKSTGIVVISVKSDGDKVFNFNIKILPLNTLNDIAEPEVDTNLLAINLEKSNLVLKTDISIAGSDTGQALYSVLDIDVNAVSDLITLSGIVELKRELEFQGAKLMAHYLNEVMWLFESNTKQVLELPTDQLKKLLLANAIAGCIALEIVGSTAILDLNRDWTAASTFIGNLL